MEKARRLIILAVFILTLLEGGTFVGLDETDSTGFLPYPDWLGAVRRQESIESLGSLGVDRRRQYYPGFPDGELHLRVGELATEILKIVLSNDGISSILTMGEEGCDGHQDHQKTHEAAEIAQAKLAVEHGRNVDIYSLDNQGRGAYVVDASQTALDTLHQALMKHRSQWPLAINHWGEVTVRDQQRLEMITKLYGKLFERQTFNRITLETALPAVA
jgi:LmbE family N-acetylglucosaminyl deacetylase